MTIGLWIGLAAASWADAVPLNRNTEGAVSAAGTNAATLRNFLRLTVIDRNPLYVDEFGYN